MISFNQALFLFTLEVGWLCWLYSFFKSYRFWKYALGGTMLSMLRLWLLYLSVIVLGSFHPVISLPCIYWRKIVLFLFINFHFHSLPTFFGIVWQLCHGMPIQTSFKKTNPTCRVRFPDVRLHVSISVSVSVELGLRFQQSFHTIHLLRSSGTHPISSHLSIAAGAIYPTAEMVLCFLISMDRNCSTICLHLLEYLALHSAILSSEWFILE